MIALIFGCDKSLEGGLYQILLLRAQGILQRRKCKVKGSERKKDTRRATPFESFDQGTYETETRTGPTGLH